MSKPEYLLLGIPPIFYLIFMLLFVLWIILELKMDKKIIRVFSGLVLFFCTIFVILYASYFKELQKNMLITVNFKQIELLSESGAKIEVLNAIKKFNQEVKNDEDIFIPLNKLNDILTNERMNRNIPIGQ